MKLTVKNLKDEDAVVIDDALNGYISKCHMDLDDVRGEEAKKNITKLIEDSRSVREKLKSDQSPEAAEDDRVTRLEAEIELLRECVDNMVLMSRNGLKKDEEGYSGLGPNHRTLYLNHIKSYGSDVLAWMELNSITKKPS